MTMQQPFSGNDQALARVSMASRRAWLFAWSDRVGRTRTKLTSAARNARYIERLIREPKTIGADAVANLVMTVNLVIEARCNIRCSCCHYFATRDEASIDRHFDLAHMLQQLDEVPNAVVAITGGEPLMSPERVVETAQALLRRRRAMALVTNCLPLADPLRGDHARWILLNGLSESNRGKLRIQCSVDLEHQAASRLPVEEYAARCRAAIRYLSSAGFPVFTRTILTSREDYEFFKYHVLPLAETRTTLGASVQPDVYNLPRFVDAFNKQELGDIGRRIGPDYLNTILDDVKRTRNGPGGPSSTLRTAPWCFIEIGAKGVKGPSSFVSYGAHHPSVLEMFRSYDWLSVADSIVPQITISRNASLYRIDRRKGSVTLNVPHVFSKILWRLGHQQTTVHDDRRVS